MRQTKRGTRAKWIRLALAVAFVAQGITICTLLPRTAAAAAGAAARPALGMSPGEIGMIATLGLVCLLAAHMALRIFVRQRAKYEELLRRSEAFARATVDALPAHIAIVDASGAILSTNRPWRAYAAENGGQPDRTGDGANYLAECDRAAARGCVEAAAIGRALRDVLAGKVEQFDMEYPAHGPNRRRWFQARVTRFAGQSPAAVVSHEDVTARKAAEERHENPQREAEASSAAKSAFIANVSQEIRTPMNAILGYAEMMLQPNVDAEHRRKSVKVIRRNGEHLLAIINDILDVSRLETSHGASTHRVTCDLPQLVADVLGLTQPKATAKGLRLVVTFDELIPREIQTDPVRAKQVLVNLVGNAIKFTASGLVRLHVSRNVTHFQQTIQFAVGDTGVGMTGEQVSRLFRPFRQADGPTHGRFGGGAGLGLTISKRLAQILGGDISVESHPGAGSTFTFSLDGGTHDGADLLRGFTQEQLDVPDLHTSLAGHEIRLKGKVLLAEDGEDNQELLTTFLRQAGIQVALAPHGEVAVRLARSEDFDLILMDMQMPVMDGYRAACELRRSGYAKPIVAVTAMTGPDDRARCLAAGCSDYLSKPVDRQKLLSTCAGYLPAAIMPLPPVEPPAAAAAAPQQPEPPAAVSSVSEPSGPAAMRSSLEHDPRVAKVLDRFVSRLPERVAQIRHSMEEGDLDGLRKAVHNLKGAGSGYGFAALSQQSGRAEQAIKAEQSLAQIRKEVDQLIGLIRQVQGYDRGVERGGAIAAV